MRFCCCEDRENVACKIPVAAMGALRRCPCCRVALCALFGLRLMGREAHRGKAASHQVGTFASVQLEWKGI